MRAEVRKNEEQEAQEFAGKQRIDERERYYIHDRELKRPQSEDRKQKQKRTLEQSDNDQLAWDFLEKLEH